jgi:hypothetical protein
LQDTEKYRWESWAGVGLVLEGDVYQDGKELVKNLVCKLYGSEKKVNVKGAASDSSTSP